MFHIIRWLFNFSWVYSHIHKPQKNRKESFLILMELKTLFYSIIWMRKKKQTKKNFWCLHFFLKNHKKIKYLIKYEILYHYGNLWMIIHNYILLTPYKMKGPLMKFYRVFPCILLSLSCFLLLPLYFTTRYQHDVRSIYI